MQYTQTDLDNIDKALASGTLRVKYQDKEVEYRSVAELKEIRNLIADSLNVSTEASRRSQGVYCSGL